MAMRKSIRRELNKSRELLWHLMEGKCCCFCKKLLIPEMPMVNFGTAQAPPLSDDVMQTTIHHVDEKNNPRNQELENRKLCHRSCHKRHHAIEVRPCDHRKSVVAKRLPTRHLGIQ